MIRPGHRVALRNETNLGLAPPQTIGGGDGPLRVMLRALADPVAAQYAT